MADNTVINDAWYKANMKPANWTKEFFKKGWQVSEETFKKYRSAVDDWMEEREMKGLNFAVAKNKTKKDAVVALFVEDFRDELSHVDKDWLWESASHLINFINDQTILSVRRIRKGKTVTPSPGSRSRRGSESSTGTIGLSKVEIHDAVPLGRCNVLVMHPGIGEIPLAVSTCLSDGYESLDLEKVNVSHISLEKIKQQLESVGIWDDSFQWTYVARGETKIMHFPMSFPAVIQTLNNDRIDDSLKLTLTKKNAEILLDSQFVPPQKSSDALFSENSSSSVSGKTRSIAKSAKDSSSKSNPTTLPRATPSKALLPTKKPSPSPSKGFSPPPAKRPRTKRIIDGSDSSYTDGGSKDVAAASKLLPPFASELVLGEDGKEDLNDSAEQDGGEEDEDILGKMNELRELGANVQLTAESWERCCTFFKRDPVKARFEPFKIPGMSKSLYSYQLHSIDWILRTVRGVAGGCWEADEMGLGKTAQIIGLEVMNTHLRKIWVEIIASRHKANGRHLLKGHTPQAICPSDQNMFFCCPCKENGFGAWATPIYRPTLILSPLGIMDTWSTEFFRFVDMAHKSMDTAAFRIAHGDVSQFANAVQKKLGQASVPKLSMDAEDHRNLLPTGEGKVCIENQGMVILTTPQSYASKLDQKTRIMIAPATTREVPKKKRDGSQQVDRIPVPARHGSGMLWGHIIIDESQDEKRDTSHLATILRQHIFPAMSHYGTTDRPKLIYLSGTPCQRGPLDMEIQMQHLETDAWANDNIFKHFVKSEIGKMVATYKALERNPANVSQAAKDQFYQDFPNLLRNVMICRTSETKWFEKPLLKLPPKKSFRWSCKVKAEYQEALKKFAASEFAELRKQYQARKEIGGKKFVDRSRKLRICYTFPALLAMLLRGEVDLTWREIQEQGWVKNGWNSPYGSHIDEIIASSAKVDMLDKLRTEYMDTDIDNNPEKLVIMTFAPVEAFILFLYLQKSKLNPALYSSSIAVKERERMKAGFQDAKDSEGNFVVSDKSQRPDFLIGTIELLHKGLQLTRAFRLVLFSPDVDFSKMRQAEKRENRIGQRNAESITYTFCNEDSPIDVAIIETSGRVAAIIDRVLGTSAVELDK